jgi:lambda repressor-like predicted transcriptional regulator
MDPIDIQYELKKRGISQKQIAKETERSEMSISKVIRKESTSKYLMQIISEKIERDPTEVFPEHFNSAS